MVTRRILSLENYYYGTQTVIYLDLTHTSERMCSIKVVAVIFLPLQMVAWR